MSDRIIVRGLRVSAHVGVSAEERSRSQVLLVSVEAWRSLSRAAQSDELADTIDYGVLVQDLSRLVVATEARLLERIAGIVGDHLLSLPEVSRVVVEIAKESPPVKEHIDNVAVRIERP
ncbi:MAG: dihydroneopterin aldolase [Actinomycetota bacterium]|nr:dihydroneopterin aldolase [Actinomycetota bacterium]